MVEFELLIQVREMTLRRLVDLKEQRPHKLSDSLPLTLYHQQLMAQTSTLHPSS